MNNKEPKMVKIPLRTEHEFYKKNITIINTKCERKPLNLFMGI